MRFDPSGQCLPVAIDFITKYIQQSQYPASDVEKIINLKKAIIFLDKNNFNFFIKFPVIGILEPFRLSLILSTKSLCFSSSIFLKKKNALEALDINYVILYHATSLQLYGIKGLGWSHFVVGYRNHDTIDFFDPLMDQLKDEYPTLNIEITEKKLSRSNITKVLIW